MLGKSTTHAVISGILFLSSLCCSQHAVDSLLFTISLNSDSLSLFYRGRPDAMDRVLAGPVLMKNGTLLFYSDFGYALYSATGAVLDSYCVISPRLQGRKGQSVPYRVSFPADSINILLYKNPPDSLSPELFFKTMQQKGLKKVSGPPYETFRPVYDKKLCNYAHRLMSNEMGHHEFLKPHLVGFSSLDNSGRQWWCLERFFSFTSPLFIEENGVFSELFPGFDAANARGVRRSLIEPLGTYQQGGEWFHYGVSSQNQDADEVNTQTLFICDRYGNLLYTYELLKRTVVDAVLGENKAEKMVYTVRQTGRYAFTPVIDRRGDIYYAVADFDHERIEVFRRRAIVYQAVPCGPLLEKELEEQRRIALSVDLLPCSPERRGRPRFPSFGYLDERDSLVTMSDKQLTVQGYSARIDRSPDEALTLALRRAPASVPVRINHIRDSLARRELSRCPCRVSLHHVRKGELVSMRLGIADSVVSARVIEVSETGEVFVRIDLADAAWIVVFDIEGKFINRFVFNREPIGRRRDVVAVSRHCLIVEKDFEIENGGYRYCTWKPSGSIVQGTRR